MRWRVAGRNWEGREWWLSLALVTLLRQINEAWPNGNPVLDGTVASKGHDAISPNSDHRPWPHAGRGVVRAGDVWVPNRADGDLLCEQLRMSRDPRISYVIFNGQRFQSTRRGTIPAWVWHPYTGRNPHPTHVHASVTPAADLLGADWEIALVPEPPKPDPEPLEVDMFPIQYGDGYLNPPDDARVSGDRTFMMEMVRWLQESLNIAYGARISLADGKYGPETAAAVAQFTSRYTGHPRSAEGTWFGGRQFANVLADLARAVTEGIGGGVSEERVRTLIAGTKLVP